MKAIVTSIFVAAAISALAQTAQEPLSAERFVSPPNLIADIVLAPRHLNYTYGNPNHDGTWFCITNSGGMSNMARISVPYVTLAGEQFDLQANRDRQLTTSSAESFFLVSPTSKSRVEIRLPNGMRVSDPTWSTNGRWIVFMGHDAKGSYLFVADPKTGLCRQVTKTALLPTLSRNIDWLMDETAVFTIVIPDVRPVRPAIGGSPTQPRVMVSDPTKNRARPIRGLMETDYDKLLLEHFITGQLARIDLASGKVTPIGKPAMIRSFSAAPDGTAFRVTQVLKPFSYLVGMGSFGSKEELWDAKGNVLHEISNRPMRFQEDNPNPNPNPNPGPGTGGRFGGGGAGGGQGAAQTPAGKRSIAWRPDGKGISYLEREPAPARREGEEAPTTPQRRKDRLYQWMPPYGKDDAKVIYESDDPISSVQYSQDANWIFVPQTRAGRSEMVAIDLRTGKSSTIYTNPTTPDFYNPMGTLVSLPGTSGVSGIAVSPDSAVFLRGTQYDRDPLTNAPRPFLDRVMIADGKKERIWQSSADVYETIEQFLDPNFNSLILNRQSPTAINDSYLFDRTSKTLTQLTANKDYAPEVTKAQRYKVRVTRPDGFKFWVSVSMPSWWVKGTSKLPAMFWFYPSEYVDQRGYDESKRTQNKNLFPATSVRDMEILTLYGYAFVEPDCPIIGAAERKNDSYIPDLRNNLAATIDELEKQGFIDRGRLAIGGHSYGAFSTANAMIHTPFFKAGLAGDGCYLRMLTPMQFQAETRLMWDARETYLNMSPLLYAEQMTGALLMYHGLDDLNPGTHPINSERMFNALDSLGKDVALYMYPYEDHGPIAVETSLDIWARWLPWIEKYVKNAGK